MTKKYYFTAVQSFFDSWKDVFNPELRGPYESVAEREEVLKKDFQGNNDYSYIVVLFVQGDDGNLLVDDNMVISYF